MNIQTSRSCAGKYYQTCLKIGFELTYSNNNGAGGGECTGNGNNNNNNNPGGGGGGGDAGGGNNNNNNNNNPARRKRNIEINKQELIIEALESCKAKKYVNLEHTKFNSDFISVENQPLNQTITNQYESQARNHINQYFAMLKNDKNLSDFDLKGSRNYNFENHEKFQETAAIAFFENLLNSFDNFKEFCKFNPLNNECAILETERSLISELLMK